MSGRGIVAERDELLLVELRHLNESIVEIKERLNSVTSDLSTVRLAELKELRALNADHEARLQVLQYQGRRAGALSGMITGTVVAAVVAAAMHLLLK